MSHEIERKYLVNIFSLDLIKNCGFKKIEQFYISYDQTNHVSVRMRKIIPSSSDHPITYEICTKVPTSNPLIRIEIEKEISASGYEEAKKIHIGSIINKTRYYMNWKFELDVFDSGLVLVEKEFKTLEDAIKYETFEKPAWIGKEVTGDPEYYNSFIAGVCLERNDAK